MKLGEWGKIFEKEEIKMSSLFGGGGLGSFHSDVLSAEPSDLESAVRLTTEIKSRAVSSIKQGNFPEAIALYAKAIEVNSSEFAKASADNGNTLSILLANRSMCHLKMGSNASALEDASAAIDKDSTYVKAYYRKGMAYLALQKHSDAKAAFQQGLAVKPDDKELAEQLAKVSSAAGAVKKPAVPTILEKAPKIVAPQSGSAKAKSPKPSEEEDEDVAGPPIRGYKQTADGRKTTFFNHDLSEEAKALIGDIAPKKLDQVPQLLQSAASSGTGSAWNTAGTFESINMTAWCTQRLTELVQSVSVEVPGGGTVSIDSVSVVGEGEVVSNRGKVKRICDFAVTIKWTLRSADGAFSLKGSSEVIDITADEDFEFGEVKIDGAAVPACLQTLFNSHVKAGGGAFNKAILAALKAFCVEFKSKGG